MQQRRGHVREVRRVQVVPVGGNQARAVLAQVVGADLFGQRVELDAGPDVHAGYQRLFALEQQAGQAELVRLAHYRKRGLVRQQSDGVCVDPG